MTFKNPKLLKELAKYQANIQTGKNIKKLNDDKISSFDWKNVDKWKQYSQKEALINSPANNFSDFDITNAKLDELINGKHMFMIQLISVTKKL